MSTRRPAAPDPNRIAQLRRHLRSHPADGPAWLEFASILSGLGRSDELHHALEQAIKSQPESREAWLLAGRVQQRENGLPAALRWLDQCARDNPGLAAPRRTAAALQSGSDAEATWARADRLRASEKWSDALDAYRSIEPLRPGDPLLLNNIGSCLASLEDYDAASQYFKAALRLRPGFTEAALNQALIDAMARHKDRAMRSVETVLREGALDADTRHTVTCLRDILIEHERIEPALQQALKSGEVSALQEALSNTPPVLCAPHERTVATLETLAGRTAELEFDDDAFRQPGNTAMIALVESCAQCKLDGKDPRVRRLFRERREVPEQGTGSPPAPEIQQRLINFLQVTRERTAHRADQLQGGQGEAWLKYWHARLLQGSRYGMPGHYKLVPNAIAGRAVTPPENVVGTIRALLSRILPALRPGPGRAIFLYMAVNIIHGFGDGNGRLGRFLLGWEMEAAGLPPIAVPPRLRARSARAMDAARLQCDVQPMVAMMHRAHAETGRLLTLFSDRG